MSLSEFESFYEEEQQLELQKVKETVVLLNKNIEVTVEVDCDEAHLPQEIEEVEIEEECITEEIEKSIESEKEIGQLQEKLKKYFIIENSTLASIQKKTTHTC